MADGMSISHLAGRRPSRVMTIITSRAKPRLKDWYVDSLAKYGLRSGPTLNWQIYLNPYDLGSKRNLQLFFNVGPGG